MLIGTKYKIEADSHNLILKEKTTARKKDEEDIEDEVKKEPGWKIIGYFYDFRELLKFMADNEIKGTGVNDLETVSKKQEELYSLIFSLKKIIPGDLLPKFKQMTFYRSLVSLQNNAKEDI